MAHTKIDSILLGKGPVTDNSQSVAIFTSNAIVDHYNAITVYGQYNCAESGGHMWRSKVAGNVGNLPASSPAQWERLYNGTKDGDFVFVSGSGATIQQRELGQWLVFGNHPGKLVTYEEPMAVVSGGPANDNEITGPLAPGAFINLPLDSRDMNSTEYYVVGSGDLEIYLNGIELEGGNDWLEVGLPLANSSLIQINIPLLVTDRLKFERKSTTNLTGYGGGGGGGGSVNNLQDAYNGGNTIVTNPGLPFTVTGSPGKCAVFNGDIDVTGIIDPKAITFSREGVNPVPSLDGIWVDSVGELNYNQNGVSNTNISQALKPEYISVVLKNNTGSSLAIGTPVCLNSSGELKLVNVNLAADAESFIGLVAEVIANGSSGKIAVSGKLQNVVIGFALGSPLWVSKTGALTNVGPDAGIGGFVVGDWVIKIGMISKNLSNPLNKDIILNSSNRGQL